ncbi:transposase, partial [Devosia psychrophila]
MERRKFSREFKLEAVKLVRERGVAVAQAARDLDLHVNVLRKWVRDGVAILTIVSAATTFMCPVIDRFHHADKGSGVAAGLQKPRPAGCKAIESLR